MLLDLAIDLALVDLVLQVFHHPPLTGQGTRGEGIQVVSIGGIAINLEVDTGHVVVRMAENIVVDIDLDVNLVPQVVHMEENAGIDLDVDLVPQKTIAQKLAKAKVVRVNMWLNIRSLS